MRRLIGLVLVLGSLTWACQPASAVEQSGISPSVRKALLDQAELVAASNGDDHPYDIEAVRTTRIGAIRLTPGTRAPTCESSPACADATWYVVAMRGRFTCGVCSHPPGAEVGPGEVIMLQIEARTPLPRYSGFSLGDTYPKLRSVGVPVRLGALLQATTRRNRS